MIKASSETAHKIAKEASKRTPNKSDSFAYARAYSRVLHGLMNEKDMSGQFNCAIP